MSYTKQRTFNKHIRLTIMIRFYISILTLFLFFHSQVNSYSNRSWNQWIQTLRSDAIEQGIQPKVFDDVFKTIKRPNPKVIKYDKNQPEKRITYLKYQRTRVDPYRITIGKKRKRQYKNVLPGIAKEYGVNQCYILSQIIQ